MSDQIPEEDAGPRVPHDDLAEKSIVGGMLLSARAIDEVLDTGLQGRDFYGYAHELIFRAITHLATKGQPVDQLTVAHELERVGVLAKVGGMAYIGKCAHDVPTAANAAYYADIVADLAEKRRLVQAGTRIAQLGLAGDDAEDLLAQAETEIAAVGRNRQSVDAVNFADRIDDLIDEIDGEVPASDEREPVMTGFIDLDRLIRGLRSAQMIVISGRPGMGKSTVSRDICRHAAFAQGKRVLFHTLEMSRLEVEHALLAAESQVPLQRIAEQKLRPEDWTNVAKARARIADSTFIIDGDVDLTLSKLRASIRRNRPDIVVIDQIQLMTPTSRKRGMESRQEEVGAISRGIKKLAKAQGIPIIAVSKMNRGPEQRNDKKPTMSDLRDSGDIESDADVVILLHREDAYEKESPRAGELDLIVDKQRSGPKDTVTVAFQGHYARAKCMSRAVPPPPADDLSADAILRRQQGSAA